MAIWFALLAVPVLVLVDQSLAYVAAAWACPHQDTLIVHGVHVPFLLAAIVATVIGWQRWRRLSVNATENETLARRHFLAGLATGAAALSALVIAAMWAITWVLRSCVY
jgi:hypothetical protein